MVSQREASDDLWVIAHRSGVHQRGSSRRHLSSGVLARWHHTLWRRYRNTWRQGVNFFGKGKWIDWAKAHPRLLSFLSLMFVITWIIEVVTNLVIR